MCDRLHAGEDITSLTNCKMKIESREYLTAKEERGSIGKQSFKGREWVLFFFVFCTCGCDGSKRGTHDERKSKQQRTKQRKMQERLT